MERSKKNIYYNGLQLFNELPHEMKESGNLNYQQKGMLSFGTFVQA